MPRLTLMCGPAGSGKTTWARRLEVAGAVRFSVDEELWTLGYRRPPADPAVGEAIKTRQRVAVAVALAEGRDVVVDHAFFRRADRDAYRDMARETGADVEVVVLRVPEEELRRRLAHRRAAGADDVPISDELLTIYLAGFEWPGPDEDDVQEPPTSELGLS